MAQASKAEQLIYFGQRLGATIPNYPVVGTLLCTNHRISFVPDPVSAKLVSSRIFMTFLVHVTVTVFYCRC